MLKVSALEVPPPGEPVNTVTEADPALVISLAKMLALSCVLDTKVVIRSTPFQRTVDAPFTNPVPFTVSVNAAPPAVAEDGFRLERVGTGLLGGLMVKVSALDVPPPGELVKTVTEAEPALAISLAEMLAVSCVLDTKVVVRSAPFQRTVDAPFTNPVPFTVSVNAAPPAVVEDGFKLVRVGTGLLGGLMVKVSALEVPPPGEPVKTVTEAEPALAISLAEMLAVSCVLDT